MTKKLKKPINAISAPLEEFTEGLKEIWSNHWLTYGENCLSKAIKMW